MISTARFMFALLSESGLDNQAIQPDQSKLAAYFRE